jgi:hypothetical protein
MTKKLTTIHDRLAAYEQELINANLPEPEITTRMEAAVQAYAFGNDTSLPTDCFYPHEISRTIQ